VRFLFGRWWDMSGREALFSFLRHWLWRLARPRFGDECGGSPYRLCDTCTTPDYCRRHP
jgi:hypothetical protein